MDPLTDQKIEEIIGLLKEGKRLPEAYKTLLFDTKKEYELIYADKEREEDILAETMAVPLQPIKTFRNGKKANGWVNMLIFGDNLQVLKTLLQMKREGKLKNADGTPGIRLVYIDPPFATRQEFRGSQDQKAYQDKIAGARFLEFLRKRLVFLRELLSEDGSIYVHLDYKKAHYVKTLMDELFGEEKFRNEIIWSNETVSGFKSQANKFIRGHDVIFYYAKSDTPVFNKEFLQQFSEATVRRYDKVDKSGRRYKLYFENGEERRQYLDDSKGKPIIDVWTDIPSFQTVNAPREHIYPTQKPDPLLERIIKASSNPGDLVLDCFAGSGTTGAVCEKIKDAKGALAPRRWIMIDCGKLAIYTMQKRLLNLKDERKKSITCKPFTLYNAGLYDYKMIRDLPWEQYRDFALKLFQCRDERHEISKIELDGYVGADSVLVFNYQKHKNAVMDRDFIEDLHKHLGNRIGRRFFIIAPAASVQFLEDYLEKGRTRYFILRIPYSIIEEIHNRGFTKMKQPVSEMDVNDTVDAVGFDFIQAPTVECRYFLDKPKRADLFNQKTKECVIKIERFESKVISRKPLEFAKFETLSMIMLDYDFDGEVFDLDEVFYAEELSKNGYEVRFSESKVKGKLMIIYIDIFGNEKHEVKTLSDFNGKKKK